MFPFMDSELNLSRPSAAMKRCPPSHTDWWLLDECRNRNSMGFTFNRQNTRPHSENSPTIGNVILKTVKPYRVNFKPVGEVMDVSYMVITQSAWFKGYKDMDPSLIPQFEEGDREAVARKLLDEQGVCVSLFFFII